MAETFGNALRGLNEVGASLADRRLVELIVSHGENEQRILDRYRRFIDDSPSPAVRYLVGLVIEDEHRHHRLLAQLANAVAWGWSELSPEPAVPDLPVGVEVDQTLLAETKALLQSEIDDERELKELRDELEPYADTTLWSLVADLMLLDTQKHMRILRFIREHPEVPLSPSAGS